MTKTIGTFCFAAVLAATLACGSSAPSTEAAAVTSVDTVDPIREWFNAEAERPRFITILSPT